MYIRKYEDPLPLALGHDAAQGAFINAQPSSRDEVC